MTQHSNKVNAIRLDSSFRQQGQRKAGQHRRRLVPQLSGRPLRLSFSGRKTLLSTRHGRQHSQALRENRRALPMFVPALSGRRGFVQRVFSRELPAGSAPCQRQRVSRVCRGNLSTVRRLVAFSSLPLFRLPALLVLCQSFPSRHHQTTTNESHHHATTGSSRRRPATAAKARTRFGEITSNGILCGRRFCGRSCRRQLTGFNYSNAGFEIVDSPGRFFAENVRPIPDDAKRPGWNDITSESEHGRENHSNLFGVHAGRCCGARLIPSLTECDIAGRTCDGRNCFPRGWRACQLNQLSEFQRPCIAPQKKKSPPCILAWRRVDHFLATVPE